jgi:hypothetical protein
MRSLLAILATLPFLAHAHFILTSPPSLGFDEEAGGESPCGGFEVGTAPTTPFPVGGGGVALLTTHTKATWQFNVALGPDFDLFVPVTPRLAQGGVGDFCEPAIPGRADWVGRKAVLQVVMDGHDGLLYQVRSSRQLRMGWLSLGG